MEGHAKKCVEWFCELANKTTQQLYKVSTPCIDDPHFKEEEMKSVGELSKVCSPIVVKCLYLARIGRRDILWSVNKLARAVTKWTKACDNRLARLISYIHRTCEFWQYCFVGMWEIMWMMLVWGTFWWGLVVVILWTLAHGWLSRIVIHAHQAIRLRDWICVWVEKELSSMFHLSLLPVTCAGKHSTTMQFRILSIFWFCETLRTQNQHQQVSCAYSEVKHLCQ